MSSSYGGPGAGGRDPWSQGPGADREQSAGNHGAWGQGGPDQGAGNHGAWGQDGPDQGAWDQGTWGQGPGTHGASGPGQHGRAPGGPGPQGAPSPGPGRPSRGGWLWALGALGCVAVMVLGIALGGGYLWMTRDRSPSASSTPAHAPFTSYGIGATPGGDAEDLIAALGDNPFLELELPVDEVECSLPDIAGAIPADQLAGYLRQANECLTALWRGPMTEAGFEWSRPSVIVYDPASPPTTDCDNLLEENAIYCYSENDIYWPSTAPLFSSVTEPTAEENKQMVLSRLGMLHAASAYAASGLLVYYLALIEPLEESSAEYQEYGRRYRAQLPCFTAASVQALPEGMRPEGRVAEAIRSEQKSPQDASRPARSTLTHWAEVGLSSPGVLSVCNTWTAPADAVA